MGGSGGLGEGVCAAPVWGLVSLAMGTGAEERGPKLRQEMVGYRAVGAQRWQSSSGNAEVPGQFRGWSQL